MNGQLTDTQAIDQYTYQLLKNIESQIEEKNSKLYEGERKLKEKKATSFIDKLDKRISPALNAKDKKALIELKKDTDTLEGISFASQESIFSPIESDLRNVLPLLNNKDVDKLRNAFSHFYTNYNLDKKNTVKTLTRDYFRRLNGVSIKYAKTHTPSGSKSIMLTPANADAFVKQLVDKCNPKRIDINYIANGKYSLSSDWRNKLDNIKYIVNHKIKDSQTAKAINHLGYNAIEEAVYNRSKNEAADTHLKNIIDKLNGIVLPDKKNKQLLDSVTSAFKAIYEKNNKENINITNYLKNIDFDSLDNIVNKYRVDNISNKFKSTVEEEKKEEKKHDLNKGNNLQKSSSVDNIEQEDKMQIINDNIRTLRASAFNELQKQARYSILYTSDISQTELINQTRNKMKEYLGLIDKTPEERAQIFLRTKGRPMNESIIKQVAATMTDYSIGVSGYKELINYINEKIEDKQTAKKMIDDSLQMVFGMELIEEHKSL